MEYQEFQISDSEIYSPPSSGGWITSGSTSNVATPGETITSGIIPNATITHSYVSTPSTTITFSTPSLTILPVKENNMSIFSNKEVDFWIDNNYNVLFKGNHGVGKTARVVEAFERRGLKWKYFSAATIDPWVDFVGIPKEVKDENGHSYISFVRPRELENDEVEALFFDEFNRAPKKVRNAVMELIQFKSINGKKLHNLKLVWAAINENDDDNVYDIEDLDPAQLDRFQIHIDIPYKPDKKYFSDKFGKKESSAAIEWWHELTDPLKKLVSPRRLEYALISHRDGGNMKYILPAQCNPSSLLSKLTFGSYAGILSSISSVEDNAAREKLWEENLSNVNFYSWVIENIENVIIMSDLEILINYLNNEDVSKIITTHINNTRLLKSFVKLHKGHSIMEDILEANMLSGADMMKISSLLVAEIPISPAVNSLQSVDLSTIPQLTTNMHTFCDEVRTNEGKTYSNKLKAYTDCLNGSYLRTLPSLNVSKKGMSNIDFQHTNTVRAAVALFHLRLSASTDTLNNLPDFKIYYSKILVELQNIIDTKIDVYVTYISTPLTTADISSLYAILEGVWT